MSARGSASAPRGAVAPDSDVHLHAAYVSSAAWLYNVIDAALWLASHRHGGDGTVRTRIVLHPVRSRARPVSVARWLGRRVAGVSPSGGRLLRGTVSGPVREAGGDALPAWNPRSLYGRVEDGETVSFEHDRHRISVGLPNRVWWRSPRRRIRARRIAARLRRRCFDGGRFVPSRYLDLEHDGIHIGDLAASSTLRRAELAGSLRPCPELWKNLTRAIDLCERAREIDLDRGGVAYAMAAEPIYLDSVLKRALHARGASVVELAYRERYRVVEGGDEPSHPWVAGPPSGPVSVTEAVRRHLDGRLFDPANHLWYMVAGANDNEAEEIRDHDGVPVVISRGSVAAVVFLHSFDDGQYFFGLDGFDDLFHWTRFTIDRCLSNRAIDRVLIKDHPATDPDRHPAHVRAVRRLHALYGADAGITFLGSDASLVRLCERTRLFGITHHGSVAEELVHLGQPAIGSSRAPWGEDHPFLTVWRTVEEYGRILDRLGPELWSPPSDEEVAALHRFVEEYRLHAVPPEVFDPWIKFAAIVGEPDVHPFERHNVYERRLEDLEIGDPTFSRFMDAMSGGGEDGEAPDRTVRPLRHAPELSTPTE